MARQATQRTSTFVKEDEKGKRAARPIPPKAKRMAVIFTVYLAFVSALPALIEAGGTDVRIGPWLSLLITLPGTLIAMVFMGWLRDGIAANVVSGVVVLFALTMGYALRFEPGDEQRAMLFRAVSPATCGVLLVFFWLSLRTHLRDLHYWIAEGQSLQDIMMRYQQANVIRKAGGTPAMTEDGKVVDAKEFTPRKGFRQKPQKTARQQGEKKKRKRPKVR